MFLKRSQVNTFSVEKVKTLIPDTLWRETRFTEWEAFGIVGTEHGAVFLDQTTSSHKHVNGMRHGRESRTRWRREAYSRRDAAFTRRCFCAVPVLRSRQPLSRLLEDDGLHLSPNPYQRADVL